jgi:hypothetical protein
MTSQREVFDDWFKTYLYCDYSESLIFSAWQAAQAYQEALSTQPTTIAEHEEVKPLGTIHHDTATGRPYIEWVVGAVITDGATIAIIS